MTPQIRTVVRTRYWFRVGWRGLTAACVLWGLWYVREPLAQALDAGLQPGADVNPWLRQLFFGAASIGVIVVVMWAVEGMLVRWLLPDPVTGCSRCGYPAPLRSGPCPECGLDGEDTVGSVPAGSSS